MNEQVPNEGEQQFIPTDLSEFDAPAGAVRTVPMKVIAGVAAGVLVLGGATAGFLWVSSAPGGDAASAAVPGPLGTSEGTATATEGSVSALGARDIFAGTVAPNALATSNAEGDVVTSSTAVAPSAIAVVPSATVAVPTGRSVATSIAPTASSSANLTNPNPYASVTATSSAGSSGAATVPWQQPDVRIDQAAIDYAYGWFWVGDEKRKISPGTGLGLTPTKLLQVFPRAATATATDINGIKSLVATTETWSDLGPVSGQRYGWMSVFQTDPEVPQPITAAAQGNVTGVIRIFDRGHYQYDKSGALFSLNGGPSFFVADGDKVGDTGLVYNGAEAQQIFVAGGHNLKEDAVLADSTGNLYWTAYDASGGAGVRY